MFKFGQIEVASKDFYKQRQITDILTIDVNKVVLLINCQVDGKTIIPVFIKTPKNIFSYGVSQYDNNSAYTMSFNVSKASEWVLRYRNIWNEVESQLFEKLTT